MVEDLDAVRLDVALYFQRNPFSRETCDSVAMRVGRRTDLVAVAIERLVDQSVLERRGSGKQALYRYHRPYLANSGDLNQSGR